MTWQKWLARLQDIRSFSFDLVAEEFLSLALAKPTIQVCTSSHSLSWKSHFRTEDTPFEHLQHRNGFLWITFYVIPMGFQCRIRFCAVNHTSEIEFHSMFQVTRWQQECYWQKCFLTLSVLKKVVRDPG